MGVDANGVLFYGYVESGKNSKVDWSKMEDIDGEDYKAWEKKLKPFHVQSGYSGDCGRYIAVAYFSATHRYWETIEPAKMVVQPDWDERLQGYAKVAGIDLGEEKPQWHLIAYFD
jgi:hypothetical protein